MCLRVCAYVCRHIYYANILVSPSVIPLSCNVRCIDLISQYLSVVNVTSQDLLQETKKNERH